MWRKLVDFGCGTLGDMGVHIFDTPYNALNLDVPLTIKNKCRKPNNYGFPEENYVEYEFPGTKYTTEKLKWIWEDGKGSPSKHKDLKLPNNDSCHYRELCLLVKMEKNYYYHILWKFQNLLKMVNTKNLMFQTLSIMEI